MLGVSALSLVKGSPGPAAPFTPEWSPRSGWWAAASAACRAIASDGIIRHPAAQAADDCQSGGAHLPKLRHCFGPALRLQPIAGSAERLVHGPHVRSRAAGVSASQVGDELIEAIDSLADGFEGRLLSLFCCRRHRALNVA